MRYYLWGVLAMASLVSALFFLQYWRTTRDRLFAFFSAAFALMAVEWTVSASLGMYQEGQHFYVLLLRILAFVAIIVGVLDKNRRERHRAGS
jgi:hypothetical protein